MIEHEEHVYKETECTGVYWSYELLILVSSISWFSGLGLWAAKRSYRDIPQEKSATKCMLMLLGLQSVY